MSVDIYNKDFQNWLKGNLALTETRQVLSGSVSTKIEGYISNFSQDQRAHIEQFIACLDENGIQQLKKQKQHKKAIEWSCYHALCESIFGLFTAKYEENYALHYEWQFRQESDTNQSTGHINTDETIWRIAKLYMFIEPGEKKENYRCLDDLDISKLLKMMRNCSLFVPDGSLEIYDEIIQFRNCLMHSPNNTLRGEDLQTKLQKTRDLLIILDMAHDCNVVQYLEKLGKEDFIISYHLDEYKQVVAEVVKAKQIAFDLYEEIDVTNSSGRTHSKDLKDILEKICKQRLSSQLEVKPKKLKEYAKGFIEKKKEALELEKILCLHSSLGDSDRDKELQKIEKLQKQTQKDLNNINEQLQMTGETEMAELIDHLNMNVTILISEKKKLEDEANEKANATDAMNKVITTLNKDKKKLEDDAEEMANTTDSMNKIITALNKDKKNLEDEAKEMANTIDHMNKITAMRDDQKITKSESPPKQAVYVRYEFPASDSDSTELTTTCTQRKETESGFSLNDLEVFQKPLCLISTYGENIMKLETAAAEQIAKIDWPIVVVSVVGLRRTGKTYLMNILADSTKRFELGDTTESTTKGIWVWCKIHPKKSNTVLLLLGTKGLGDDEKGDPSHDNRIFTLATLLCNCLVYNMKGAFDQDAVSKLTFITDLAENIRFRGKSSDDNSTLNLILPDFVLCLRDFNLELTEGGKKITEDEYFELSLAIQKGKDDKFNKPRECIQEYFPDRKCFTFPVPGDSDVLENLETLEFSQLSNRFKEATNRFVNYIYSRQPKDLLASKPINGQMFTSLANYYVKAIRRGAVPDVTDAFSVAARTENSTIRREALEIFQKQMETVILPISSKLLDISYMKALKKTLEYLRYNVVHDNDGKCEIEAQMEMENMWNHLKKENNQKVQEMCDLNIHQAYKESMERKIENKSYEMSGGHRMFQRDIEEMKEELMISLRHFDKNEMLKTWIRFMKTIEKKEMNIIKADDALTETEKQDERKRNEENMDTLMKKHKKSERDALETQRIAMENHFEKLENDRKQQNEKDMKKYNEFVKMKLKKEQIEQELNDLMKIQEQKNSQIKAMTKAHEPSNKKQDEPCIIS